MTTLQSRIKSLGLLLVIALLSCLAIQTTNAQDSTWTGDTDDNWLTNTNWTGNTVPGPVDGDDAIFDTTTAIAGNHTGNVTVAGTVAIGDIRFSGSGNTSYTIGGGNLLLGKSGDIFFNNSVVTANQTINSNLILGDSSSATFTLDDNGSSATLILNGDITTGTGGVASTTTLQVGDGDNASIANVVLAGNITRGLATRFTLNLRGGNVTLTGNIIGGGNDGSSDQNTMRTVLRDDSILTVEGTNGRLGEGSLDIQFGTVNVNNSNAHIFDGIILGDAANGNGNSTINIKDGETLTLSNNLSYQADSVFANHGTVAGGTLQFSRENDDGAADSGSRTLSVQRNGNITDGSAEFTISSNITNAGTDVDLFIRSTDLATEGATVLLTGNNSHGGITVQQGTLRLGSNTSLDTGGDFLTIEARNSTNFAGNQTATVDLMGNNNTVNNVTIGDTTTSNVGGTNDFVGIISSTGGAGSLDDVNVLNIRAGDTVGKKNGGAIIGANVTLNYDNSGTNKGITVENGSATNDLTLNGTLRTDAAETTHDFTFLGDGTVSFNGSLGRGGIIGGHDQTIINTQKFVLETGSGSNIGGQQTFTVAQRNSATFSDFDVELDINGETLVLNDQLTLGRTSATAVATQSNVNITDSAGGGIIRLTGATDNNITLKYEDGTGGAFLNLQTIVTPDILFNRDLTNWTATINVEDGADAVDLILNGTITARRASDSVLRGINKSSAGTLQISSTGNSNLFTTLNIQGGTVRIAGDGSLGNNDVILGSNAVTSTLEYFGSGENIDNQFRIGDGTVDAGGTRVGGGIINNTGTGTVTFTSATFNQGDADVTATRDLTLTGNTSDIAITGTIIDNSATGSLGITKTGNITATLDGDNTYTGNTTVSAGRLNVNGAQTGNGDFTVAADANLGGEGSTAGNLTFGGNNTLFINPGTAAAFTTTGSLTVTTGNVSVDFAGFAGAGNITALTFGTYANAASVATEFIATNAVLSARPGGSTTAQVSGNSVVFDLGFASRTWAGNGTNPTFWANGNVTDNNWVEGDNDFFNGDAAIFSGDVSSRAVVLQDNIEASAITFTGHTTGFTVSSNSTETLNVGSGGLNFFGDNAAADDRIDSEIIGSGTITKGTQVISAVDVGRTFISGNNSDFTGITVINQGDLEIEHVNALGNDASNTIRIADNGDNGRLHIDAVGTIANDIIVDNEGTGKTITFDNGGNTVARALTMTGSVTQEDTSSALNYSVEGQREEGDYGGTTTGRAVRDTHVLTVTGKISSLRADTDGAIQKSDDGTLILANAANDYTGQTFVYDGTLRAASIGNVGEASHLGASRDVHTHDIRLGQNNNDGTLVYTGAGAESTDRQIQLGGRQQNGNNNTGGGQIVNNGGGALVFTNAAFNVAEVAVAADVGARNLTLAGTFAGTNEIDGVIQDNTPTDAFVDETVSITVDTNGTWQLDGANLYTGNTTVNAGSLYVNGSTAAGSAVTVGGGGFAATLGGSGTINGNVTVNALGNQNAGTAASLAATQTFGGNVTHTGGTSSITWDLIDNIANIGGGTTSDKFVVAGVVDFAAATSFILDFNGTGIEGSVDWTDGFWANDQEWNVITAAGGLNGSFANLTLGSIAALADSTGTLFSAGRPGGSFALNNTVGTTVTLNYTAAIPEPGTYGIFGLGLALFGWTARRRRRKAAAEAVSD